MQNNDVLIKIENNGQRHMEHNLECTAEQNTSNMNGAKVRYNKK